MVRLYLIHQRNDLAQKYVEPLSLTSGSTMRGSLQKKKSIIFNVLLRTQGILDERLLAFMKDHELFFFTFVLKNKVF